LASFLDASPFLEIFALVCKYMFILQGSF
jgi:hypothetical protein